jgi:hypothetical protein
MDITGALLSYVVSSANACVAIRERAADPMRAELREQVSHARCIVRHHVLFVGTACCNHYNARVVPA